MKIIFNKKECLRLGAKIRYNKAKLAYYKEKILMLENQIIIDDLEITNQINSQDQFTQKCYRKEDFTQNVN